MIQNLHIDTHKLFSGSSQTVQRTCFDQMLYHPFIHFYVRGTGDKILKIRENASALPLPYDFLYDRSPDAFNRRQRITDSPACHRKAALALIDIRRQHLDSHILTSQNILGNLFRIINHGSHQRRHKFYGIIIL